MRIDFNLSSEVEEKQTELTPMWKIFLAHLSCSFRIEISNNDPLCSYSSITSSFDRWKQSSVSDWTSIEHFHQCNQSTSISFDDLNHLKRRFLSDQSYRLLLLLLEIKFQQKQKENSSFFSLKTKSNFENRLESDNEHSTWFRTRQILSIDPFLFVSIWLDDFATKFSLEFLLTWDFGRFENVRLKTNIFSVEIRLRAPLIVRLWRPFVFDEANKSTFCSLNCVRLHHFHWSSSNSNCPNCFSAENRRLTMFRWRNFSTWSISIMNFDENDQPFYSIRQSEKRDKRREKNKTIHWADRFLLARSSWLIVVFVFSILFTPNRWSSAHNSHFKDAALTDRN